MAELTTKARDALPDDAFALPGRRYPIHDKAHARNALARASQELSAGDLTIHEFGTINRKAHAKLKE